MRSSLFKNWPILKKNTFTRESERLKKKITREKLNEFVTHTFCLNGSV